MIFKDITILEMFETNGDGFYIVRRIDGIKIGEIWLKPEPFFLSLSPNMAWRMNELEYIINFCKGDVYSPDKVFGKIFYENCKSLGND